MSYWLLFSSGKSFKPLHEKFYGLGGFYNGIGYAFPEKSELPLKKLTEHLPDVKIHKMRLAQNETFESMKEAHKADFFREKLQEVERNILQKRGDLPDFSEESLKLLSRGKRESLEALLQEKVRLEKAIEWALGMEKALSHPESVPSLAPVSSLLDEHELFLQKYRGKSFIGLRQMRLPTLDRLTLGLRGLGLLAAAPNVGKTALTIQLALDVLQHNKEACVLYLSLEMSRHAILSRIRCHLSEMDFETLTFGSNRLPSENNPFLKEDLEKLERGNRRLLTLGKRLFIATEKECPDFSITLVKELIQAAKKQTGSMRVFVILDYLQVWPIPEKIARILRSDLEADKWRIGQLKLLAEELENDPILSISEARKPDKNSIWAGEIADIMGSARGAYTPDMLLLYRTILDAQTIRKLIFTKEDSVTEEQIEWILKKYEKSHCDLQQLTLRKGRDGMKRGALFLKFYYRKNSFQEISLEDLRAELKSLIFGRKNDYNEVADEF